MYALLLLARGFLTGSIYALIERRCEDSRPPRCRTGYLTRFRSTLRNPPRPIAAPIGQGNEFSLAQLTERVHGDGRGPAVEQWPDAPSGTHPHTAWRVCCYRVGGLR